MSDAERLGLFSAVWSHGAAAGKRSSAPGWCAPARGRPSGWRQGRHLQRRVLRPRGPTSGSALFDQWAGNLLRDLADDDMFGEMSAIDGESRRPASSPSTDARLLAITAPRLQGGASTHLPQAALWLLRQLTIANPWLDRAGVRTQRSQRAGPAALRTSADGRPLARWPGGVSRADPRRARQPHRHPPRGRDPRDARAGDPEHHPTRW